LKRTFTLITLLFFSFGFGQNVVNENKQTKDFPSIDNYVNDYDDILSFPQEVILKESLKSFEKLNNIRIVIVTVDSISPYQNIFDYSLALAKQTDFACVYIVVCKSLRVIQIQNCDDILPKLTNEETKTLIEDCIIPEFKKGNYFIGLENGIFEIKKELQ